MRLIWTGEPVSETRLTLKARGYEPSELGLSEQAVCRIGHRFPVLISQSGRFVGEAFSFLFDVAFVRGSTRSARTLETYAESLLSWLKYAEDKGVQWRKPVPAMLAAYRDNMLGTDGQDRRNTRPLSRRTINLRLTVAIEFYKHLGCVAANIPSRSVSTRLDARKVSCDEEPSSRNHGRDFQRLRVRIYSRRPKALHIEQCRALSQQLRNPYRLIWQWALCTGLRTCSLVRIELQAFQALSQHSGWGQTIDLIAKGGKVVSVHVPAALIAATARVRDRLEALNHMGANLDAVKVVQSLLAHADGRTTEQYLESIDIPSLDVLQVLNAFARTDVLAAEMT